MKKKFVRLISAVLSAAMTLTAVPLSAFAEGETHTHDGESNVITTPLDFREKKADENGVGWSWDYDTKTLTLDEVNIQATTDSMSVVTVPDGTEIVLNGNNTIVQTDTGDSYTYILSAVNTNDVNCDGTMTISGEGVLNAENRSTDSMARSLGGSIIINGGTVNATGKVVAESLEIHNDGALNAEASAVSNDGAAVGVKRGITVDGNGSLTAVGGAVENEYANNGAILLNSNFGDKISVSGNGSITVPEGNAAKVGIYYDGNKSIDAEISGGKVTAYGTKCGIYKVNLIMSGTGSVYATGGTYGIGQTVPTIDEDEFVVKGSTEFKASESAVTGEVKYNSGYYEIGGADAKTVVIKPDTSPRIILGKQTGIFKTEEYEIIEGMTDTKLKGTVYFDITLKNMSDEEFADARGYFGGDEPDLLASIIKTDYGWVCMVCDTEFSTTYDTDNTLTIKCGDIVSNTVQVKSNANRFNKVTQGDNTNRTVFYTNTSQEEKDNYKLVSTYTVDSESISYNWYSTNSAYSADELGAAVSGSNGEFKLADNILAGNYVLYCDITYSDGDSTETVTEKFTFTYKECAHENGYSDGKCTNCGALCDHSNIDIDTGKCNECGRQFVATISTDGSAPTGCDTLADCLDSITADTGNYVKIYQDIGDTSATATLDTIDVKHNVMIDLNGHKLNNIKLGVNKLGVNKDVTLTLTGTAGSYVTQVYVRKGGGSFIIDSEANVEFNTIFVEDSARLAVNDGAKVTTEQLTVIASVNDDGTTTTSVKLATGMKLGGLTYHRQNNSGALKLGNLLDVTRQALRREDNGNYLDLYKEYGSMGYSVALTVVEHTDADHKYGSGTGKCEECGKPCEHGGDINTDTGICSICGAVVSVALYTDKNGSLKYVDTDELHSLLNEYNGSGTIKLFKDYSKPSAQYDLYGELTIDVNGRQFKIRSITPCKSGKLTIKNSGNPVMLGCNVYPTNDASYAGGTLIIDGDVVLDTSIYVYDSSTVILKAGAYQAGLYARDSKTLYDMLGEGKAFFKTDGTLFNANVKEISSSETLTIKDHSHTYVDGECGCGYVCPHSDVNSETGKCNECEYQYAAVIVKDGAVASVYEENEMGAAFEAADSDANTGCTLKVYKNYAGSYTTLSRKFTLWIAEEANVGTLTVSGDITVTGSEKNNSIYGDFNVVDGGKLTFDENCGAKGTVSVGAGTFDCYRSLGIILNINDASSDVILHDGAFLKIRYNGGGDRANAEILTLLAENRMFMTSSAVPIDGSKTLLKDGFVTPVIVAPHEDHSYDSTTGKCTICGKRCGHTDVDSKTGMCKTCQYEFVATLTVGDKVTGFDSLSDCLSKTSEDSENYVKIYKNIDDRTTINVNHTVTVDLNSHKLYYIELKVNNDNGAGNLTLTGSEDSYISQVDVCGGRTFKIDSDANINFETIFVEAGARFEVSYGANVTVNTLVVKESLKLYGRTTTSVRLATGMRIGTLMYELDRNSGSGNLLLYSLLGEGKALQYDNSGEYVDIYEKFTSKIIHDSFTVVDHYEHSYDKATGKCVCGYVCPHSDVDSKTGVCSICKYQFTAGISGVGTAKYFDNIDDAFTAALSEENSGCTLTLYKDCSLSTSATITNATVTVDVNGCSLGGEADISVNNGGVLYLKDSRKSTYYGCIDAPFSVNGGTLINGTADGGSSAADVLNLVINSAKRVEIYGGIFENVYIAHASGVALYGGRYNTICGEESNSTPVNDLLAKGYAFATVQEFTTLPESIVDGSAKTIGDGLTNVMVVAHEHRYNVETGKCPCGVCALAIFTETTQSSETYTFIESETQFKNIAENEADGVLKLTGDVDCIVKGIIINGNKTIDMNGHTLNVSVGTEEISAVAVYGNVTFENSGSSRAVINATGVYSYGMVTVNGDIEFDTFATFEDGDALINAGVFKSIYVQGRSVIEILGSGKALASESGEILNASVQQIYRAGDNIFVTAHPKHTYDDHGNCACGYKCLHDGEGQVNEDSANKVCSECGAKIYAKVTTADGKVKYFDDITEGLRYADKAENKGCVFTLVTTGGLENDITLSSGQFTITAIDDNYINAYTRKINIKGAEITVENCAFNCFVGLYSGSLTYPEGSTSVCINGISVFGGTLNISDGVSENFGANKFTISDTATDAKVTIGGGIYGEIKLGQYTFKDILASGTRLISVEYSQETDEIIATNELLYSIVSEQNTLGVDDDKDYRFVKCDHKNEDGSYAFNDSGICKYCNSEFAASVSYTDGGEKTELFSDICDAFDKANEIGTATVTLYKDITDSERTQEITVMGNVTLELNGKTLGGRYGIARISVSDGGTLTVNGDGDMDTPIYVNENSKLVINGGGYFNSVSVKKGGNAEIGGGTIQGLSVRGNVKLSGGKFNDIEIFNGNLESVLADGYAYKNADGTWLSIDEREKDSYLGGSKGALSVEEAPIKSATATANKTVLYRNGGGARQISFKFNVKTSDGYTVSDANKVTVGLYVGDTLIRESDFGGNSSTFANASEISDTDGTVKAHLVIKLNGYEYVTNDVEFEIATCTHPYDALTTDEYDYYCCSLCDAGINAILVKTNGDKACYTDNVPEAFESAQLEENNGCTLELYRGVNRDCEITQGSFTVLFKKTGSASAVIKVSGGNVKFTGDDGCTLSKYPGSSVGYLIAVTGGTVTFDNITIDDDSISVSGGKTVINGGTYNKLSVSGGTVTINSGTFSSIDVSAEGKALKDLLGENKAFATSDGKLFDASKVSESDNSLTVIDHSKHEYDETGRCGCGYQCPHDDVDTKAGVCRECNTKIYAAITVKSETGTTVKYFTKLTEAFEFAAKNENKGCTLKMLRDFFDRNTDINVNGGKLTVDMNGFGVYINSFNGSGTQITIRSDSKCTFGVENGFSMDGGTVTFSGEVSVVCQNVKLNATYFSSYVETLKIDTLILEDGVLLKQLASITNANIANIDCSSEIYLYQILASGSRVDSQLYSALKANASSNFDNVRIIRCDHPDGVGRDNRCIYCNSLIAASVSYTENGAEKTEYFVKEDLGKAFAKANSVASATITMLMSSVYDTDYLPVTGDVTLIANGDNAILYNTVKVADGGKLTLRGNANIFAVIAEPGSRLTAEEATRIAYLTVNGGDVKLSGGQYDNITVKDGKITDILADGYAYKKTEGGAWLTLKEREVSEASGVTVAKAPIVKATLSTEINKLYRNSNANPTLKFNLALAHGSNLNDSYVSKRYGINSYVSGDIIYSSLSALIKDAKLSADEIIDKAGDSDAAKIYFVVTTGDGYEIKSNTVSIDLVDCDHSQVVDPTADKETAGNITEPTYCEICESKFNAKITKGDDVRYYNNLDEAAKDAQKSENEGCTLYPLYNKNGYGGQLVITEGNFTLKYAVRTAFSRPIIINGKAKLTVTGRCAVTAFENQDAFIVQGGDVTFDGLATGSNVTINGGNVTMAANNINCLTINGGNVSISSGGFAEIVTTVSDKVIADYIDPGFWVQDRGTKEWIDIYSLNKATASSTNGLTVRLCPMQIIKPIDTVYYTNGYYPDGIPSLQISAVPWYSGEVDAKVAYQWIAIDENGYETVIEGATDRKLSLENLTTGRYYCRLTYSNAATAGVSMKSDVVTATITECEHSGGEATCTKKAKCEICGAEYGEPLGHDYVVIKVVEPDYFNKGYSVFECTRCEDTYLGNYVPVKPIPDVEEIAVEKTTYNEVDISWKDISDVDGFNVECYVGDQWKKIDCSAEGDRAVAKLSGLSAGLKYKVRIVAYAGSVIGKYRYFYVDTVPSPVWNINTVKATDETVRISWSRNARADGYKVEWYINNQWSVKTVTGNNNISAVIDGLCAGTRYKVRVSAYKGDLYSPYTYGYINTLPSKVTGITQTVTSSSFTLKWDKNESADGYTAQYYADGKWNEKTLVGNNKTTVTIGSLKGYKTYKVRIKAYKGELESTFDDIYITTAPTKVSGLKVKSAVDSKAVVIWNADANADGYNVEYYIGGKWVEKTITDNKTAKAVLGGLTPYITYKVRVRAYKDNLYGDYSYTTVTAVLSPVTNIKVVSAKSNSITVKWGKNASADGYKVEIYKGGKWVKKTLKGSTNATVTIGGLRAGSVYKVRIASYKGANTSTYTYANVKTAK